MKDNEKNPFKKLRSDHEVPGDIKVKLMKEIALIQLFGDITDLFSTKMGNTAVDLLKRPKKK